MDKIDTFVVLHTTYPDDSIEENDEIIVPAGRNILEAIRKQLEAQGINCAKSVRHSFYGWTSEFVIGKVTIWLLLQHPDPWLLIVEPRASWYIRKSTKLSALQQGVSAIRKALGAEPGIIYSQWMTEEEYKKKPNH